MIARDNRQVFRVSMKKCHLTRDISKRLSRKHRMSRFGSVLNQMLVLNLKKERIKPKLL